MRHIVYFITVMLLAVITVSCEKDEDAKLVAPEYKEIVISGGGEFEIPVMSSDWAIGGVKNLLTGQEILDKDNHPMTLSQSGEVESADGWFTLIREGSNSFVVRLKDNFNNSSRNFAICITSNGNKDNVTFVQNRAKGYKLVETQFELIEGTQKIYTSDKGCYSLTLTNATAEEVWEPTKDIFRDVVYSSKFESDDYGAFEWADENTTIHMPELLIDHFLRWDGSCLYKQGESTVLFNQIHGTNDKLLVEPFTTVRLRGEMEYCKRAFNYIFTVENESTGVQFQITGVWTQIIPLVPNTIIVE